MRNTHHRLIFALCLSLLMPAFAQSPLAAPTVRVRGVIQSVTLSRLTLTTRAGEVVELQLSPNAIYAEVFPIALDAIQVGSFIGTAAMPQADGTQKAIAVMVFPESARGAGEGHRPFDLLPQSTMTNATVAQVVAGRSARTLHVKFKDGEIDVLVPDGAPIVSFKPSDASLLVAGASVSISAALVDGKPTALRINAGRNGFVLPY